MKYLAVSRSRGRDSEIPGSDQGADSSRRRTASRPAITEAFLPFSAALRGCQASLQGCRRPRSLLRGRLPAVAQQARLQASMESAGLKPTSGARGCGAEACGFPRSTYFWSCFNATWSYKAFFFEQLFTNLGVKSQGTKWIIFLYLQDEILNVYVVTISARVTYPSLCCPHAEEIGADNSV